MFAEDDVLYEQGAGCGRVLRKLCSGSLLEPSRMEWSQRVELKEVDDFELLVHSLKP